MIPRDPEALSQGTQSSRLSQRPVPAAGTSPSAGTQRGDGRRHEAWEARWGLGSGDAALRASRAVLCGPSPRRSPPVRDTNTNTPVMGTLSQLPAKPVTLTQEDAGGWEGNSEAVHAATTLLIIIITAHCSARAAARPCVCRGVPRAGHAPGRGERVPSSEQGQAASLCPSGTARPAPGAAPAPPPGSPATPGKGKRAKLTNATLRLVSLRTLKDWGKGENQATRVSCLETSCESLSFTRHSHQRPPCPLPSSF